MQRRLAEGRTRREVIRCLKRFVAREVFGLINPPDPVTATPSIAA
jgi:transposase